MNKERISSNFVCITFAQYCRCTYNHTIFADFKVDIKGVIPLFGGKCFDITLNSVEAATLLANRGFDYEHKIKPLRLLGAKTLHVAIFVSVEYPDADIISFLKSCGKLK